MLLKAKASKPLPEAANGNTVRNAALRYEHKGNRLPRHHWQATKVYLQKECL